MDLEILRWRELVARAGSRAKARRLVAEGEWWQVLHDAYAQWSVLDGPQVRLAAARHVLPSGTALSHRSAAWVLGLDVLNKEVDLTVGRGRHLVKRRGITPHAAELGDEDLCEVAGLLVVTAARAFVDVARSEPVHEAVAFGDALLRAGVATLEQLELAVDRAAGLRHVRRARTVLPHLEARSESPMESRFRMRLVDSSLPRPPAQVDVYDDEGHVGRVDFLLDGVVLEYDGRAARLDKRVFVAERRRQRRLSDLGLEIRRFTSDDYYVRPAAAVHADVVRALTVATRRDRSLVRSGPDTLPAPKLRPVPSRAELARRRTAA